MRLFSDVENELIQFFVDKKDKGIKNIADLQIARILRTKIPFLCLNWDNEEKVITIISPKGTPKEQCDKFYYEIVDCIEFIKELERRGFISIQNLTSKKEAPKNILLYDRSKYSKAEELLKDFPGIKISGTGPILLEKSDNNIQFLTLTENPIKVHLDFIDDLNKYGQGIIYPLPLAEDYVKNGYKTLEDKRYNKQINISWWSFFVALIAAICSLFFGFIQSCSTLDVVQNGKPERLNVNENFIASPTDSIVSDTITIKGLFKRYE